MDYSFLKSWRNRLVASSRFRYWVQKTPFLRSVARNRAAGLFQLMTGFVHTQVLLACVELDLFETLARQPRSVDSLASQHGLEPARMRMLLNSAAELGLLERHGDDAFGLDVAGVSILSEPGLQALVRHHRALYRDLEDPLALLRDELEDTQLGRFWPYASGAASESLETGDVSEYTRVMGDSQGMIAQQVLDSYSLSGHTRLLDVGGGNGSFLAAVAQAYPAMRLALFDLPAVLPLARQRLDDAGYAERVEFHGGNFHQQELPAGQECISLVRILHDHDDGPVQQLLQRVHRALVPGGTVLIAEPMSQPAGREKWVSVYFNFYLLAMGSGRPRAFPELKSMLEQAGFRDVRLHTTALPLVCSVISATRNN